MQSVTISRTNNVSDLPYQLQNDMNTSMAFKDMQVALGSVQIPYSWFNVTSTYGNNSLAYIWTDGVTYNVPYVDGSYEVEDLSRYLQLKMFDNGHYLLDAGGEPVYHISFQINPSIYAITYTINPVVLLTGYTNPNAVTLNRTPQLIIPANMADFLGTIPATYPASQLPAVPYAFNSQDVPDIEKTSLVRITCNSARNPLNKYVQQIYEFIPTETFTSILEIRPFFPCWYDVVDNSVDSIVVSFYDQYYRPLAIKDTNITCTLLFRDKTNLSL